MRRKMRRCFSQAEVVGLERAGGLDEEAVVEQDGAEHEALGVDIGGETFLDGVAAQTWRESPRVASGGGGAAREISAAHFEADTLWINACTSAMRGRPANALESAASSFAFRPHPQIIHRLSTGKQLAIFCFTDPAAAPAIIDVRG